MKTIDFTVTIKGIPAENYRQLSESLRVDFLKQFGIIFEPTNDVEIVYNPNDVTVWEGCQRIVAHALTHKVLQDEIKNGN